MLIDRRIHCRGPCQGWFKSSSMGWDVTYAGPGCRGPTWVGSAFPLLGWVLLVILVLILNLQGVELV